MSFTWYCATLYAKSLRK